MWFPTVLIHMTQRYLPKRDQLRARSFIIELYRCFANHFYPHEPIPIELRLGVLDKLYSWFKMTDREDINIQNAAQMLFGLLVVYTKYVSEDEVWCIDFLDLTKNPTIYETLAIQREHLRRYFGMLEKIEKIGLSTETLTDAQLSGVIERALIRTFKRIECDVMNVLRHSTSLDYDNLSYLFKRPWNRSVKQTFSHECLNLRFTCPEMNELVDSVSPIVRVGYSSMAVPLRVWSQVTERPFQSDEQRFLAKVLSLQEQLRSLRMELKNNPDLFTRYCSLRGLEKHLLLASMAYFSGETDYQIFLSSTTQAVKTATARLPCHARQNDWNDLVLACAGLNPLWTKTIKSQFACSDLFFTPAPANASKPIRAADHDDSYAFLTQSF